MAGTSRDHLTSDPLAVRIGTRLRARRIELGLTLTQAATSAGLSTSHLSALETGRHLPSLHILGRLVSSLELTMAELLRAEGPRTANTGVVQLDRAGTVQLSHPDMQIEAHCVVANPGENGISPVPVVGRQLFVFIYRGALKIELDTTTYTLDRGDSLDAVEIGDAFWSNHGNTRSVSIWSAARPLSADT